MMQFLRMAAENPDRLAIALHEYSFTTNDIADLYHYKVGRFQTLFEVVDQRGIPRPTVFITEWGWEYQAVPTPVKALDHIRWAARLYAAYPQVKGAAIWYLGCCFGGIANDTQKLIAPVGDYSISNYFAIDPNEGRIDVSLFAP